MKVQEFRSSEVQELNRGGRKKLTQRTLRAPRTLRRGRVHTEGTEEEHGGHGEEKPKSTARNGCATGRKPKRAGPFDRLRINKPGPNKGKICLAEEPAEEGLLPGFAVYFGYGFG